MPEDPAPARLHLEIEAQDGTAIVRCSGRLVAGLTDLLKDQVKGLIPENKRIILDLTDLTQMDSMGLGSIVSLYASARAAGSRLELINLSKRIMQLLRMTNVLSLFEAAGEQSNRVL